MNLSQLYSSNKKKYNTDKGTVHSYIDNVYNGLFLNKQQKFSNILEIGVKNGGSILLWHDYFTESTLYGIDIKPCGSLSKYNRIKFIHKNAYDKTTLVDIPSNLDLIIDDGPHTLSSMIFIIENYLSKLNTNGILIIEDIQSYAWFAKLIELIPKEIFSYKVIDLRSTKNRYDDMLLIIENNG